MTTKKELIIEGETYIDGRAVYELLEGVVSDNTIRSMGKNWARQKVGNRYFYRKDDVKLPYYPVAKWQKMALMYMAMIDPDVPVGEYAGNYYRAKAFLSGAGVEMLTTGWLWNASGKVNFVLLAGGHTFHVVAMDDVAIAGRQLFTDEIAAMQITNSNDSTTWDMEFILRLVEELLAPSKGVAQ
jgi:hypothetical protein